MNRIQLIIFGTIGVFIVLAFLVIFDVIPGIRRPKPEPFTITVWGFEDEKVWEEFSRRYQGRLPHVTTTYVKKNTATYESELLNALASNKGPDIFVLKNSEISKHQEKIMPYALNIRNFKNTVFDAASADLVTIDDQILGIPFAVDTLALFYNRDFFNSANIASPPKTWTELIDAVKKLTVYSEVGAVLRPGIALGTSGNVEHATDILTGLMIQSGTPIVDRKTKVSALQVRDLPQGVEGPAESALRFYTSFADSALKTYSWTSFFPNSIDAFSQGKTAMIVGYASDAPRIINKNPHLNFDVALFPQVSENAVSTYYARYNFMAVSRQSQNPAEAWKFLLWMLEKNNDKDFADLTRLAPSRRDLVNQKPPQEYLSVFYSQVLSSKTWPIPDEAKVNKIFKDMIDSVVNKSAKVETAVGRANTRLGNLLKQSR